MRKSEILFFAFFPHFIDVFLGKHIILHATIFPAMVDKQWHPHKKEAHHGDAYPKVSPGWFFGFDIKPKSSRSSNGKKGYEQEILQF